MTDQRAEDASALHGHPEAIEVIAADSPHWQISRERRGPTAERWYATREGLTLTADTPAGLLVRVETQELARLQADHVQQWRVWRTPNYWMATARVEGVEPALMEPAPGALEAKTLNPGPHIAPPYPR